MPIGIPGWPDFASSTASMASARKAFAMRRKCGSFGAGRGAAKLMASLYLACVSPQTLGAGQPSPRNLLPLRHDEVRWGRVSVARGSLCRNGALARFRDGGPCGGREEIMATIVGSGDYKYRIIENWAKLPGGWSFKEVGAVGTDKQDNVYVFNRGEHPMMVFDRAGNFLRSWGEGQYPRAHGVHMGRTIRSTSPTTAAALSANAGSRTARCCWSSASPVSRPNICRASRSTAAPTPPSRRKATSTSRTATAIRASTNMRPTASS